MWWIWVLFLGVCWVCWGVGCGNVGWVGFCVVVIVGVCMCWMSVFLCGRCVVMMMLVVFLMILSLWCLSWILLILVFCGVLMSCLFRLLLVIVRCLNWFISWFLVVFLWFVCIYCVIVVMLRMCCRMFLLWCGIRLCSLIVLRF